MLMLFRQTIRSSTSVLFKFHHPRLLFTNTVALRRDDPYSVLGIQWGATTKEVKAAFISKAKEYHPDVNTSDEARIAQEKFQRVKDAYEAIMASQGVNDEELQQFQFRAWRKGDLISQQRTDVAGRQRKRPIRPISLDQGRYSSLSCGIGHPDGSGVTSRNFRRNELLDGDCKGRLNRSSAVGTGQNKWVSKKKDNGALHIARR
eukprot:CAMPEP_0116056394 /NCGR_PEP_ID=MMETSP0322-20121206/3998_1 /TAXON_ID=163516 /ORGANISM="Leptocylindrus danicus var. apora, Strain B651" /LENGTH=203 /DNA_ID=CAMNT_0003540223 /DNA_START=24 /DNA_END=635 /DNA_ORIENTATION=+